MAPVEAVACESHLAHVGQYLAVSVIADAERTSYVFLTYPHGWRSPHPHRTYHTVRFDEMG